MPSLRSLHFRIVLIGAVTFAALMASHTAFRPVRDTLVLDGHPDDIPWLYFGTFIAVSVASPLWSALLARGARRRLAPMAYHAFALCLVGFFIVVQADVARVAVGRVFYIWSSVFNLFVVSVLWSLLADLLSPHTARQLYGPIAAGGTIGTIVGPALTKLLVGTVGHSGILLMSAVFLEISVVGVMLLCRFARTLPETSVPSTSSEPADPDKPLGGGAFTGIARVARTPYLRTIVGYVLCMTFAATFVYLAQQRVVYHELSDRIARTEFLAGLEVWQSVGALVLQLAIAAPALTWLGPAVVLGVLPVVQAVGITMLALVPSLGAVSFVVVASRAIQHGLIRPGRELLFTVLSADDKYRAKHAIDTVAYRLGDLASAWLNKGLLALGLGSAALVGAAVPLVGIWLGLAIALGIGFRRRVGKPVAD